MINAEMDIVFIARNNVALGDIWPFDPSNGWCEAGRSGARRRLTCALILHQAGFVHVAMGPGNIIIVGRKEMISDLEQRRKTSA